MNVGCGLFGLASELYRDFWGTLRRVKDMGFTAVEPLFRCREDKLVWRGEPVPDFIRTVLWTEEQTLDYLPRLQEMGLGLSSMHVRFQFGTSLEDAVEQMVRLSERAGVKHFMTSLEVDTREKADEAVARMNRACQLLEGTGVSFSYHNHSNECAPCEGESCMDYLMRGFRPEVNIQLDAGWMSYGGGDPAAFVRKYPDRLISIHLKDFCRNYPEVPEDDAFAPLGQGVLPLDEILDLLPGLHLMEHGLMIDQDRPARGHLLSGDLEQGMAYLRDKLNR